MDGSNPTMDAMWQAAKATGLRPRTVRTIVLVETVVDADGIPAHADTWIGNQWPAEGALAPGRPEAERALRRELNRLRGAIEDAVDDFLEG